MFVSLSLPDLASFQSSLVSPTSHGPSQLLACGHPILLPHSLRLLHSLNAADGGSHEPHRFQPSFSRGACARPILFASFPSDGVLQRLPALKAAGMCHRKVRIVGDQVQAGSRAGMEPVGGGCRMCSKTEDTSARSSSASCSLVTRCDPPPARPNGGRFHSFEASANDVDAARSFRSASPSPLTAVDMHPAPTSSLD